jgi:condensin complex subunit 2
VDEDIPPATDPKEARVFSSVISGLQRSYPREKMEEISTSFCFICLLHLANEQGLKLESTADGLPQVEDIVEDEDEEDDVSRTEKKVGNIWDLKVCSASTVGCKYH